MDLQSYIQLKEAYVNLNAPKVERTEEEIWEEVEAFALALVEEEGMDLSDMTWDEVREAYMSEDFFSSNISKDPARVAADKEAEQKRKAKETARVNRDSAVYRAGGGDAARKEREKDTNGNRGFVGRNGGGGQAAYETRKQGEDNLFRAGGGNAATKGGLTRQQIIDKGIQATSKKTKPSETKPPETKPPVTKPPKTETPNTKPAQTTTQKPAAPAKDRMAGASKADRMGAWAKANPKLAAAKAKRDSTRGTSATTNPLMKDLAKRMPKPAAPAKAPVAKATAAKPADSSQMRAMSKPAATKPVAAKPVAAKPVAAKRPMLSKAAPKTGAAASSALNKFASKPMKEESEFDLILAHLIEQGFGDDEALKIMVNMPEETRTEILALSEEESDKMKDKHLESGGHSARTDYSKTPAANTWGKKKMSADEREEARKKAFSKVVGDLKKKHGEKSIKAKSSDD